MSIDKMWVIYDHPKDHPQFFVVREHFFSEDSNPLNVGKYVPSDEAQLCHHIEDARQVIVDKGGTCRMPVFEDDDAVIFEVWA